MEELRVKTDMRLSPVMAKCLEEMARVLGIPKNSVVSLAVAYLWLDFNALSPKGRRRLEMLESVERQLLEKIGAAKKVA